MLYLRPNAHEEPLPLRQHTAIEGKTCGKISLVRPFAGACGLPSPALCLWCFASALDKLGRIVYTISDPGYLAVQRSPGSRRARRHSLFQTCERCAHAEFIVRSNVYIHVDAESGGNAQGSLEDGTIRYSIKADYGTCQPPA